jgi:hypothetical protein
MPFDESYSGFEKIVLLEATRGAMMDGREPGRESEQDELALYLELTPRKLGL